MEISVLGAPTFVRDRGQGPPILFLHGNPDSADLWDGVVAELEAGFRCLAPDLPGFGRSAVPDGFDFGLPAMARWVDGVVGELAIDEPACRGPLHLVLHDFGGPFGLAWAVEHPARVGRIVAINTFFTSRLRWHFWARVWRTPWLGELSMALMNRPLFTFELRRGSRKLSREHVERAWAFVDATTKRTVLELYRATDPERFHGWEERFRELAAEKSVQVLWGRHDPYLPIELAASFATGDVEVFGSAGHWLPAEEPALVADRLRRFLSSSST